MVHNLSQVPEKKPRREQKAVTDFVDTWNCLGSVNLFLLWFLFIRTSGRTSRKCTFQLKITRSHLLIHTIGKNTRFQSAMEVVPFFGNLKPLTLGWGDRMQKDTSRSNSLVKLISPNSPYMERGNVYWEESAFDSTSLPSDVIFRNHPLFIDHSSRAESLWIDPQFLHLHLNIILEIWPIHKSWYKNVCWNTLSSAQSFVAW